jgi:hypothetical protein
MTTPDKSSMVERSTTVRCCRWFFSWRGLRRELILLAWLVTLIALFHGEETWRGRRAWNQYRHELEAKGEQLDYAALIPKPVPDDQNFAATPAIKSWFKMSTTPDLEPKWDDNYSRVAERVSPPKVKDARAERRFEDLAAWETAFAAVRSGELAPQQKFYSTNLDAASRAKAAPAVLDGLQTNEALFAELRVASQRPDSRYPVNYDVESPFAILLPHLRMVKGVCQRLELKACAELAGGQSDQALEDLKLLFRLADSLKADPFLISYLVRLSCGQIATRPIWEGLAEHHWTDPQLRELETRLQQYNFIADLKTTLAAEQAASIATIELVRKKGPWYVDYIGCEVNAPPGGDSMLAKCAWLVVVPQGWYDQEELNYSRAFHLELATSLDTASQRISPARVKADTQAFEQMMWVSGFAGTKLGIILHHRLMAQMLLPALGCRNRRRHRRPLTRLPLPVRSSVTAWPTDISPKSWKPSRHDSFPHCPTTCSRASPTNIASRMTADSCSTRSAGTKRTTAGCRAKRSSTTSRATGSGNTLQSRAGVPLEFAAQSPPASAGENGVPRQEERSWGNAILLAQRPARCCRSQGGTRWRHLKAAEFQAGAGGMYKG